MTKMKINSNSDLSKKYQDKTDWKKVYEQSQKEADKEAARDDENPVLKNARFKRLKDRRR